MVNFYCEFISTITYRLLEKKPDIIRYIAVHRKKGITLLLKIDDQTWQILAFLPHVPLSQPNSMNREERELIKLTINRGASPFWP